MKQLKEKNVPAIDQPLEVSPSLTIGHYAHTIIAKQFRSLVKQEKPVLADDDPEHLHQMRVASRRLRTALQVFAPAIVLPDAASEKQIGALAKILGGLRDLDVQIADLRTVYRPQLEGQEKELLNGVIQNLRKSRRQAFTTVAETLKRSRYRDLKAAYETWLEQPQFTPIADLPLQTLLPDLLSPLLAELLLHAGWLVPADYSSPELDHTLHDLRKAFKHVRYQTEFFTSFYGESFENWVTDIKHLQEKLGKLQDSHVLAELLTAHLPKRTQLPTLQADIQQTRSTILTDWDEIRQHYLEPNFRLQLHQMLLNPDAASKN